MNITPLTSKKPAVAPVRWIFLKCDRLQTHPAQRLRWLIGFPSELVQHKVIPQLDNNCRDFISKSPFVLLSTSDSLGKCDVSPRGDNPGFVHIVDNKHLVIPEIRAFYYPKTFFCRLRLLYHCSLKIFNIFFLPFILLVLVNWGLLLFGVSTIKRFLKAPFSYHDDSLHAIYLYISNLSVAKILLSTNLS
jgi:hypothetical protein